MGFLQIRNVPDDLHRSLKARAALEGISLGDLALRELERAMARPTRAELLERVLARPGRADEGATVADEIRAERDAR